MKEPYLELALWADLNLEPGTKARLLCPYCGGGQSKEKSLTLCMNEDSSLWWRCFRASCGESGSRNATSLTTFKAKKASPRPYERPLVPLRDQDLEYFERVYGLSGELLEGVKYGYEDDRYYFPVFSPNNKERGTILRSFSGAAPKVLTFRTNVDEPFIGWEFGEIARPVIVEDVLSAKKVRAAGGTAVFLNGTYLNYQMVTEIASQSEAGAILALDKGTFPLMLKYKRKFDTLADPLTIWSLEEDLKYEPVESIRDGLLRGKTDFRKAVASCSN